jgi:hypothetical protein
MDFSAFGMVFLETRHALYFGSDKTEVQLRLFRGRAFAKFAPVFADGMLSKLKEFTPDQI